MPTTPSIPSATTTGRLPLLGRLAGTLALARWLPLLACLALAPALAPVAVAQEADQETARDVADAAQDPATEPAGFQRYPEAPSVTTHSVEIDGERVVYTATAGTMDLADDGGDPRASLFYIAYRRVQNADGVLAGDADPSYADADERPITFSFNGGPGSSSVWLHLGLFGPRRVAYADEVGNPGPPPYGVVENAHSLLDVSDFVFIDPVSTGYSRAADGVSEKAFHGLEADLDSVAEFIRRYITAERRWRSPKIIAGESYGTTRAAGLAQRLLTSHGIAVSGIVLISPVLDFQTIRFGEANDLPFAMFLPSYAAAAHYHGALPESQQQRPVEELVADARAFALGEYLPALLAGASLPEARRQRVRDRLSQFTGLAPAYLERSNLRVTMPRFAKQLLSDQRRTIGRLDARFTGIDGDLADDRYGYDPSYEAIRANYTESLNAYVREELGYRSDLPYEILTSVWPWDYGAAGRDRYVSVSDRLRDAMHRQPHSRLFVAMGYHDLATPFFAAETTLNRMRLAPDYRGRVELRYYPAGHMMYVHAPTLERMRKDLVSFYASLPR